MNEKDKKNYYQKYREKNRDKLNARNKEFMRNKRKRLREDRNKLKLSTPLKTYNMV